MTEQQPSTGNQAAIRVVDSVIQQDSLSVWCARLRGTQQCGQCEKRRGKCVVVVVVRVGTKRGCGGCGIEGREVVVVVRKSKLV